MISGDEILDAMKVQMEEYKQQYNDISKEIEAVGKEYQTKIDELQKERLRLVDEGNAKLDQLKLKREQISGMHAGLYNQYTKFKEQSDATDNKVSQKENTSKKPKVGEVDKKKNTTQKNSSAKSQGLSEAEKAALSKIVNKEQVDTKLDNRGNEIPEYLQEDYNK